MITFLKPEEQHQHPNGGGWVANTATVDVSAFVGRDAQVYGDAWVLNPLTITGSAHTVSLVSYTQIAVGCEIHDFAYWLKNYKTVGKENGYTPEQIKEYGEILNYLVKAAKPYIKRNKAKVKHETK